MDKFDQTIKDARETYEPNAHFVDNTMDAVTKQQVGSVRKWHGLKFGAPIAAGAVVVVALVLVLLPGNDANTAKGSGTVAISSTGKTSSTSANEKAESETVPSGSSNADLSSDLNSVQSAMNQEGTDQNSANSALNDQQQEITVPTD